MNPVPPAETEQTGEFTVPVNWRHSRRHKERVVLAGAGPPDAKLMFITSSVLDEDTIEQELGAVSGISFKRAPALMKGAHGVALRDMCVSVGISMPVDVYFTALCKWLLPKDKNLAPKLKDGEPGFACLEREIQEVKPEIVVVFGKAAFEFMVSKRLKFGDALGAWFWSDKFQCRVMPMNHYYYIAAKPEWTDRFRMDFAQVKMELDTLRGVHVEKLPLTMTVINTAAQLQAWVDSVQDYNLWSIDCEWHGKNHVDGELRSLQVCWRSDQAIYIRFRDADRKYVFDVSYEEAGKILAKKWNSPELKLVGHHISADLPWTSHLLKLEWFGKCVLDSEFAFQCVNEHADLGLERMSVRFTDLGRYEMDLEEWKRSNSELVAGGYGHIPDDILIPYACKDVVVVFRAAPIIWKLLDQQQMVPYYRDIMNPFVTDVFTSFALTGLPMNYALIDEMRDVYEFARLETEKDFRDLLKKEAWQLLAERFVDHLPPVWHEPAARKMMVSIWEKRMPSEWEMLPDTAAFLSNVAMASASMGGASVMSDRFKVTLEHAITAASFNLRSTPHMKKWLFQVKGYTPVKSTAKKTKGIPAMDWSKVMTWPPHRREGIEPAVDKQTLKILASVHSDVLLEKLLELNAVGNICKAFLKQPERDEEGNVTAEAGLPAWIASDGRTHGQTSMTETGRPRSWNPNSLNWPSYLQDKVKTGIEKALRKAKEENRLPDRFHKYLTGTPVLPLRSVVQAPPGFVVVESDYQTAEVRGLAFISGDENLIRIMTRPDSQFGLSVNPMTGKKETVRLNYAGDCGIPPHNQNPDFIMSVWVEGKFIRKVADSDLVRDKHGNIVNSKVDLHWSLAEMFKEVPREMLTEDEDRKAGKAGNFKCLKSTTKVLTDKGEIAIVDVKPGLHKIWDGVEWVDHDGLLEKPPQELITYAGLTATVDHGIWTSDGREIFFGEAALQGLELAQTQNPDGTPCFARFGDSGYGHSACDVTYGVAVPKVQLQDIAHASTHAAIQTRFVLVYVGPGEQVSDRAFQCHASEVQPRHTRIVSELQRTWYTSAVSVSAGVCAMGTEQVARRLLPGEGLRQNRQQWTLSPGQPKAGGSQDEFTQHTHSSKFVQSAGTGVAQIAPGCEAEPKHCSELVAARQNQAGNSGVLSRRGGDSCGSAEDQENNAGSEGIRTAITVSGNSPNQSASGEIVSIGILSRTDNAELETLVRQAGEGECAAEDQNIHRRVSRREMVVQHLEQIHVSGPVGCGGVAHLERQHSKSKSGLHVRSCTEIHGSTSGSSIECVGSSEEVFEGGHRGEDTTPILGVNGYRGRPKEVLLPLLIAAGFEIEIEPVYDLVNAGPRHRFTAGGWLVSNTAYGSTPGTLERSIESDTGKKPEPGTGQKILDALQRRQPVAVEFLNSVEKAPHDPGYLRAASGKVRHFVKPPSGIGLNDRLRKSILSAQGREARNFFMQESVAATAMRAAYHLLCFARKFNLVGRPITVLYDSVVTLCPLHERFIWTKAHEICMYLANGWQYHGRVLRYPIDNKFNTGWGLAPKLDSRCKAWHDKIPEKDFAGTPENLKPLEKWLDDVSEFYRKNENASLVFTGLA